MDDDNRWEEQDLIPGDPLRTARGIALGIAIGSIIWVGLIGLIIAWLAH